MVTKCPNCASISVGKIGTDQYYCWDCFVEFNDRQEYFTVSEDGTLTAIKGE